MKPSSHTYVAVVSTGRGAGMLYVITPFVISGRSVQVISTQWRNNIYAVFIEVVNQFVIIHLPIDIHYP